MKSNYREIGGTRLIWGQIYMVLGRRFPGDTVKRSLVGSLRRDLEVPYGHLSAQPGIPRVILCSTFTCRAPGEHSSLSPDGLQPTHTHKHKADYRLGAAWSLSSPDGLAEQAGSLWSGPSLPFVSWRLTWALCCNLDFSLHPRSRRRSGVHVSRLNRPRAYLCPAIVKVKCPSWPVGSGSDSVFSSTHTSMPSSFILG